MIYTERKPILLQFFLYLYFFDALATFVFYVLEPSGEIGEMFLRVFGNISLLFLLLAFFLLLINQFFLFPLRGLFILLSLFIIAQPIFQFAVSIESLKYIDIFEYQIYDSKLPPYLQSPTTLWLKVFAIFQLFLAASVYYFLHTKKAINKFGQFHSLVFIRKNNILLAALNVFSLLLLFFISFVFFSQILFKQFVSNSTADFLNIQGEKLIATAKYYRHEKRNVNLYLIPMMHIAESNFYREILIEKYPKDTISLVEGVSDEKKLLTTSGYGDIAKNFDLANQQDAFQLEKNGIKTIAADVDVSSFNQTTIKELGKVFSNNFSNISSMIDDQIKNRTSLTNILYHLKIDLIDNRNNYLLNKLHLIEKKHKNIMIPWGALHMRGIEKAILKEGYKKFEEKSYYLVNIRTMMLKAVERWSN